ncbi:hypothetical protein EKO23_04870 [Nocardioides guangzhouensis]|uniref:DUF5134 domain-containing protein n=1 Tax=Nocardioides guangzhouensis TaxID=2497878 RepID=A0A4Q4ZHK2_9ACTN|nr:DUF5134 domain-containing protein [Nocardioides guangzhouensis]RYP87727.1 hypothetical protein EKO23_04870 [Nocardioides guangzhouensis]
MSLIDLHPADLHLLAGLACLVAALVMLSGARSRASRTGHAVVVATMAALVVAGHSVPVALGCAVALAATAVVLSRTRDSEGRACSLDVAVCSGLVMLMALPLLLAASGHGAPEPGEHGLHAGMHAAIPGHEDHQLVLGAVTLLLVGAWAVSRRRLPSDASAPAARIASWAMAVGMGAMVVA